MGGSFSGNTSQSRSRSEGTSVNQVDPLQQDFLKRLYFGALGNVSGLGIEDGSGGTYNGKLDYYADPTVVDQSQNTLRAYGATRDLFERGGGPSAFQGELYNQQTLGGQFLNPETNRFLNATYDNASDAIVKNFNRATLPSIQSRFGTSGNSMSAGRRAAIGGAQDVLGDDLRRLAVDLYGGNYQQERNRQEAARDFAPRYEEAARARIGALGQVGEDEFQYRQRVRDEDIQRFEFNRDEPYNRLARFSDLIGRPVSTGISRQKSKGDSFSIGTSGGFNLF